MADEQHPHLKFEEYYTSDSFRSPQSPRSNFEIADRDRREYGSYIQSEFNNAISEFEENSREVNEEAYDEDIIYLEFESEPGFQLKTDSFDDGRGKYRLSYSKIVHRQFGDEEKEVQKVGIYINKKGVTAFFKKIEKYIDKDTKKAIPETKS